MRVHSLQAVGRKAELNFTLHIFHQERPISECKVFGIEELFDYYYLGYEPLFLWHLAFRDKRKGRAIENRKREMTYDKGSLRV